MLIQLINKNKLKPELQDCFVQNETLISDPTEISNKFNEYFVNVNLSTFLGKRLVNSIFLDAVTENEVEFEIRQLNGNKSCGHDEIPPKLVKKIAKHIIRPLTYI